MFETAQPSVSYFLKARHQILMLFSYNESNFTDRKSPPISTLSDWSQDSAASSYRSRPKSNNEGKQNIVIKTLLTASYALLAVAVQGIALSSAIFCVIHSILSAFRHVIKSRHLKQVYTSLHNRIKSHHNVQSHLLG